MLIIFLGTTVRISRDRQVIDQSGQISPLPQAAHGLGGTPTGHSDREFDRTAPGKALRVFSQPRGLGSGYRASFSSAWRRSAKKRPGGWPTAFLNMRIKALALS
ncbi:putative uncharacterized protein [Pseudomonas sp. St29]|nr:putative uncharacterized protein [Pseudomonas sp. St29]